MRYVKFAFIGGVLLILAGCSNYKEAVNLSAEQTKQLEDQVTVLKKQIADFKPSQSAIIPWQATIDLARTYEKLGDLGKAIGVYEDVVNGGKPSKSILNNLGRLYEQTGQYDKAIAMYKRISDQYFDHNYFYDITWAYLRAGDLKNAEKYFNAWQLEFRKTDQQTQDAIKQLKDTGKAPQGS